MEQKVMLLGLELVHFTNDKNEEVKFTKLYLMDSDATKVFTGTFIGSRTATLNTTLYDESWLNLVGQQVVLKYDMRLGSKTPRFTGIALA